MRYLRWVLLTLLAFAGGWFFVSYLTVDPVQMSGALTLAISCLFLAAGLIAWKFRGRAIAGAVAVLLLGVSVGYAAQRFRRTRQGGRPRRPRTHPLARGPRRWAHRRHLLHPRGAGDLRPDRLAQSVPRVRRAGNRVRAVRRPAVLPQATQGRLPRGRREPASGPAPRDGSERWRSRFEPTGTRTCACTRRSSTTIPGRTPR